MNLVNYNNLYTFWGFFLIKLYVRCTLVVNHGQADSQLFISKNVLVRLVIDLGFCVATDLKF